jgi:hypothetical protein
VVRLMGSRIVIFRAFSLKTFLFAVLISIPLILLVFSFLEEESSFLYMILSLELQSKFRESEGDLNFLSSLSACLLMESMLVSLELMDTCS